MRRVAGFLVIVKSGFISMVAVGDDAGFGVHHFCDCIDIAGVGNRKKPMPNVLLIGEVDKRFLFCGFLDDFVGDVLGCPGRA